MPQIHKPSRSILGSAFWEGGTCRYFATIVGRNKCAEDARQEKSANGYGNANFSGARAVSNRLLYRAIACRSTELHPHQFVDNFMRLRATHVAGFYETAMHGKCVRERLRRVPASRHLQVFMQRFAEIRMRAVVDDQRSALREAMRPRRSATPNSVATTCTECSLWSMWLTRGTMVLISAFLGRRKTGEDRKIGVARKVARTADAVHHLLPHTWVLFTFPKMSISMAVLIEINQAAG